MRIKISNPLVLGVVLTVAAAGCTHTPVRMTNLPAYPKSEPQNETAMQPINPNGPELGGYPIPNPDDRQKWIRDRELFKTDIVHFDYDSSMVKIAEKPKLAAVADHLKANGSQALEIEGHCDERGTEEYNRSLGERRALALREALAMLGVDPNRLETKSYGKDRPLDTGHDTSAHSKNRRGEFVLAMPPQIAR